MMRFTRRDWHRRLSESICVYKITLTMVDDRDAKGDEEGDVGCEVTAGLSR